MLRPMQSYILYDLIEDTFWIELDELSLSTPNIIEGRRT